MRPQYGAPPGEAREGANAGLERLLGMLAAHAQDDGRVRGDAERTQIVNTQPNADFSILTADQARQLQSMMRSQRGNRGDRGRRGGP